MERNRQVVALNANTWLNFLPDMYTLTGLPGGFYEGNPAFPTTARNQPIGFQEVCGTFSLFNNALLALPGPFPQRTFTITGGSWNPAASTLTLTWRDGAANGATTVFGTTTFVRTGDQACACLLLKVQVAPPAGQLFLVPRPGRRATRVAGRWQERQ